MAYSVPGLPPERLKRRLEFLIDRAGAHNEFAADNELARACAATLKRDAACVALLLDDTEGARRLLTQAGHGFLSLGLPVGASLIALANLHDARKHFSDHLEVIQGAREQWKRGEKRERSGRPMSQMARKSPRQLLAMMQADWMVAEVEPREPVDDEFDARHARPQWWLTCGSNWVVNRQLHGDRGPDSRRARLEPSIAGGSQDWF